jgi:hypothetical protein
MSSRHTVVELQGTLQGMGRTEYCQVRATKVNLPNSNEDAYGQMDISYAPPDLPEGLYELSCEAGTVRLKKERGFWLSAGY